MAEPGSEPESGGEAQARVGTTVAGRYYLQQLIGRGGVGDVYEAATLGGDRVVAVKLLRGPAADGDARARRFEREAAVATRLSHPHCVEVHESGRSPEGLLYLVMERVPGLDLSRLLAREGPLPATRATGIARQVLEVLAEAHAAGVTHRDLKPANVMIDPTRGPRDFVKVLDFGIAAIAPLEGADAALTQEGIVHGTPAYMSPEQIRGEPLDARSDLYSVGALLQEMLTGAPPFEGLTPMAIAAKVLTEPPRSLAYGLPGLSVPPGLEAVLRSALAKDRSDRPVSADAMSAALAAAVAGAPSLPAATWRPAPPTAAFPAGGLAKPARAGRAPRRLALAAAAAGLAAAAVSSLHGPASRAPRPAAERSIPAASAPQPPPAAGTAPAPRAAPKPSAAARSRAAPIAVAASAAPPPIRLVRGELNALPTPPADTGDGVLVVQATPWAEVSVAGTPLGETPREVRLAAGAVTVRAIHPELGIQEERVVIRPGERTVWIARFAASRPVGTDR